MPDLAALKLEEVSMGYRHAVLHLEDGNVRSRGSNAFGCVCSLQGRAESLSRAPVASEAAKMYRPAGTSWGNGLHRKQWSAPRPARPSEEALGK